MRRLLAAAFSGLIAFAAGAPPAVAADKFTVSGKKGPFIKQVSGRRFENAGGGGSLGLASDAVNQGQFQAARLPMPHTEARVKALLQAIEANWPYDKALPTKVVILGLDYYNAYSLPDGSVVVGFGLLDRAQSDDEVAFILAHELGHIRLGHFAQQSAQQERAKSNSRLGQVFVMGGAGALALAGGGSIGSAVNATTDAASRRAGATGDLLRFVNEVMVAPSMSRAQEDEADALGFDLAQMDSYSAESASARVFDTIQKDEDNRQAMSAAIEGQLTKELGKAASLGTVSTLMSGNRRDIGLGMLRGAGRVAVGVAGSRQGGPKHRSPEDRKAGIADYSATAYPDGLPLRDEKSTWLNAVRASREYADARVTVTAVRAAMEARAAGRYPEAEAQLARVSATAFAGAPMVINERARLKDDEGDAAASDRLFIQAHRSPDQTVDGYLDHVRMLYRTGQTQRAYEVIDLAQRRFNNDDKPFLSMLVALSRKDGRQDQAEAYHRRCLSYGDEGLTKDCDLANGGAKTAAADAPKKGPRFPVGLSGGLSGGIPRLGF